MGFTRASLLRLSLFLVFALVLAACGDDDADDAVEDEPDVEQEEVDEPADEPTEEPEDPADEEEPADEAEADNGDVAFGIPADYDGPEADLPTEYDEPDSCDATIGWQNAVAANENLTAMERAAVAEVERLGGEIITLDDQVDPDTQVSNMQQLLAQDVDAIGFLPLDPGATDPVLAEAAEQGVPVLAIEATLEVDEDPGGVATQIYQGRDIQGFLMANYTLEQVGDGSEIAIIGFAPPVPSVQFLVERMEFWAGELGLDVVQREDSDGDDAAGGERAMNPIVASNPDIAALMAYNDPTALGAAGVARGSGMEDVVFVGNNGGQDGLDGVADGRLGATFQNDAVGIGTQGAWALCTLADDPDADVPPIVVRPPSNAITEDNVDQATNWDEQLEALGAE